MKKINYNSCPACGERLRLSRLACPGCRAEFPMDTCLSPYDYLSEHDSEFLKTFLSCRGNMKEVQEKWNISYPTAKKKLDDLLLALELNSEKKEDVVDLSIFEKTRENSIKASDIIRNKLYENGGQATVSSARGNKYIIRAVNDGKSFCCDQLPINPPYQYAVFDVIVDLLIQNGGKARKGNGRNFRLGYGDCTEDTVVGAIAKKYAGKDIGSSVFDPVFVLVAVLEWANIAHNCRGYIEFTAEYRSKISDNI